MKKIISLGLITLLSVSLLGACSGKEKETTNSTTQKNEIKSDSSKIEETKSTEKETKDSENDRTTSKTKIKASPDKYTHYIKNYVGRNASSCGSEGSVKNFV